VLPCVEPVLPDRAVAIVPLLCSEQSIAAEPQVRRAAAPLTLHEACALERLDVFCDGGE
jgi:hypothetical protein